MKQPQMFDYDLSRRPVTYDDVRRMPNYDRARPVAVEDGSIPAAEFERKYWRRGRPVILRGGVRHWPAVERWASNDYLQQVSGDEQIEITRCLLLDVVLRNATLEAQGKDPSATQPGEPEELVVTMPLQEYIERCTTRHDPGRILYARLVPIPERWHGDVGDTPFWSRGFDGRAMFMGRKTYTDSHEHGGLDVFSCQVRGTKEFILHAPDAASTRRMYAGATANWSPVRFFDPDLERFPLFAENQPIIARLEPGDVLYIPNPWWHAVVSTTDDMGILVPLWFKPAQLRVSHPQSRRLMARTK
jgi:hypothetical protein